MSDGLVECLNPENTKTAIYGLKKGADLLAAGVSYEDATKLNISENLFDTLSYSNETSKDELNRLYLQSIKSMYLLNEFSNILGVFVNDDTDCTVNVCDEKELCLFDMMKDTIDVFKNNYGSSNYFNDGNSNNSTQNRDEMFLEFYTLLKKLPCIEIINNIISKKIFLFKPNVYVYESVSKLYGICKIISTDTLKNQWLKSEPNTRTSMLNSYRIKPVFNN